MLMTDPMRLIRNIIVTAIVVGLILFLMKRFMFPATSRNPDRQKFVKAARQSKKKFKSAQKPSSRKKRTAIRRRNVSASHLTVIEGKKGKKKNRALH